ncbi:hypothetical protein Pint_16574 [Pistacia integerrima]|uniref:Uncharacterized protein n=1 Tax=Pistacia integerrima TaxID=434235 RepID=A0ACC0Z8A1_9ROSI|nr:hypothetical protein Pint_16574 [Pistacia integerrima]
MLAMAMAPPRWKWDLIIRSGRFGGIYWIMDWVEYHKWDKSSGFGGRNIAMKVKHTLSIARRKTEIKAENKVTANNKTVIDAIVSKLQPEDELARKPKS